MKTKLALFCTEDAQTSEEMFLAPTYAVLKQLGHSNLKLTLVKTEDPENPENPLVSAVKLESLKTETVKFCTTSAQSYGEVVLAPAYAVLTQLGHTNIKLDLIRTPDIAKPHLMGVSVEDQE